MELVHSVSQGGKQAINCLVCMSQFCHEKWDRFSSGRKAKYRMGLGKSVKICKNLG